MPDLATTDFTELLARARQGDSAAAGEIVRQYEPEVRILARVLLGPALRPVLDSVDLVQSVHRTLLVGLRGDKYEVSTPDRLLALALTVVRRKVARAWRKAKRQVRPASTDPNELAALLASLGADSMDPARTAQLNDAVRTVLGKLGESERRLIELRLLGHSTAEAARELGEDPDVLRVKLSRTRQKLRETGVLADWL